MNLLAIDSYSSVLSVAVSAAGKIHYSETEAGVKHSQLVMNCIDSQMKEAELNPSELNGVLCMKGPGSFTGLRIGYSAAKGLALSLSIPFMPIPTFDCIAFPYFDETSLILPVIGARKNAWFFTLFRGNERLLPDADGETEQITAAIAANKKNRENVIITGTGALSFFDSLAQEQRRNYILDDKIRGYAKELIMIAKNTNLFDNFNNDVLYSGPEYIRNAVT